MSKRPRLPIGKPGSVRNRPPPLLVGAAAAAQHLWGDQPHTPESPIPREDLDEAIRQSLMLAHPPVGRTMRGAVDDGERSFKRTKHGPPDTQDIQQSELNQLGSSLADSDPVLAACRCPDRPEGDRKNHPPWRFNASEEEGVRQGQQSHREWHKHPSMCSPIRWFYEPAERPGLRVYVIDQDMRKRRQFFYPHTGLSLCFPIHVQQYRLTRPLVAGREQDLAVMPFNFVLDQQLVEQLKSTADGRQLLAHHNRGTGMTDVSAEFVFAEHIRRLLFDSNNRPLFFEREANSTMTLGEKTDYEEAMAIILETLGVVPKNGQPGCRCLTVPYRRSGSKPVASHRFQAAEDRIRVHSFALHNTLLQLSNRIANSVYVLPQDQKRSDTTTTTPQPQSLLNPEQNQKELSGIDERTVPLARAVECEWLQPLNPEESITLLPLTAVGPLMAFFSSLHDNDKIWQVRGNNEVKYPQPWSSEIKEIRRRMFAFHDVFNRLLWDKTPIDRNSYVGFRSVSNVRRRVGEAFFNANPSAADANTAAFKLPPDVHPVYMHTRWRLSVELPSSSKGEATTDSKLNQDILRKLVAVLWQEVADDPMVRVPLLPVFPWMDFGLQGAPEGEEKKKDDDDMDTGKEKEKEKKRNTKQWLHVYTNPNPAEPLVSDSQELLDAGLMTFFQLYMDWTSKRYDSGPGLGGHAYQEKVSRLRLLPPMPMKANLAILSERGGRSLTRDDSFEMLLKNSARWRPDDAKQEGKAELEWKNDTMPWADSSIGDPDYKMAQELKPWRDMSTNLKSIINFFESKTPKSDAVRDSDLSMLRSTAKMLEIMRHGLNDRGVGRAAEQFIQGVGNLTDRQDYARLFTAPGGGFKTSPIYQSTLTLYDGVFSAMETRYKASFRQYTRKFDPCDNIIFHLRKQTVTKAYFVPDESGEVPRSLELDMKDVMLVVPIHQPFERGRDMSRQGGHYFTVLIDSRLRRILVWDPLNPLSPAVISPLSRWFEKFLPDYKPHFITGMQLQVGGGNDCGRFVIWFCKNYVESLIPGLSAQGVEDVLTLWGRGGGGGGGRGTSSHRIFFGWDPEEKTLTNDARHMLYVKGGYFEGVSAGTNAQLFREFQKQLWRIYNRWNPKRDLAKILDRSEEFATVVEFPAEGGEGSNAMEDDAFNKMPAPPPRGIGLGGFQSSSRR